MGNISDFPEEPVREGHKHGTRVLTVNHDELFSQLAPEFRELARGWFWRLSRSTKLSSNEFSRRAILFAWTTCTVGIYFWLDGDDVTFLSKIGISAIAAVLVLLLPMLLSQFWREHLLLKKAKSIPLDERRALATDILNLAFMFTKENMIGPELAEKARNAGLSEKSAFSPVNDAVDDLHRIAEDAAKSLMSEDAATLDAAFKCIAGDSISSLTGTLIRLREAVEQLPAHIEALMARQEIKETIRRRRAASGVLSIQQQRGRSEQSGSS